MGGNYEYCPFREGWERFSMGAGSVVLFFSDPSLLCLLPLVSPVLKLDWSSLCGKDTKAGVMLGQLEALLSEPQDPDPFQG